MSEADRLPQYRGPLTPGQAAKGIRVAIENASALLADAELLFNNRRWQRAAALAILAIEESTKVEIIREILIARNQDELKKKWRAYRTHTSKNYPIIMADLAAGGARKAHEYFPAFEEGRGERQLFESVKQIALYTDAVGKDRWCTPNRVKEKFAAAMLAVARIMADSKPRPFTTEPELEIWVKHMRPALNAGPEQAKRAAIACYTEAESKGVLQGSCTSTGLLEYLGLDPKSQLV